ncbi:MAG: 6-carboxyhexanoate--CoA ligase [Actinomycetota bacterium]
MASPPLFSVRMRASAGGPHEAGGRHLSGAERLASAEELEQVALELLRRGRAAHPSHLRLSVHRLTPESLQFTPCLPITTIDARDPEVARLHAEAALRREGVRSEAIEEGFRLLREGAHSDGRAIAGAVLLDSRTGKCAASAPEQGVRASRFDYAAGIRAQVRAALEGAGLGHFRAFEAVALATKVIWAGVLAELCWSDDPAYVAGYVATGAGGYVRFPRFKPEGAVGGRIFYVAEDYDLPRLTERLTRTPLLIATVPEIR